MEEQKHPITFVGEGIMREEEQGQRFLVGSAQLPIDSPWEELAALGIYRGADIDEIFCEATIPSGWTKNTTDHPLWFHLKDARGLLRMTVFYKDDFHNRQAFAQVIGQRFRASKYADICDKDAVQYAILDNGRGCPVMLFEPVYVAASWSKYGAICAGVFYSKIDFRLGKNGEPKYTLCGVGDKIGGDHRAIPWPEAHQVLHRDDLDMIDDFAKKEALEWLSRIPADASQWGNAFDFPEVGKGYILPKSTIKPR